MNPIMKAWMFYNWSEDYNDEFKLLENQGYLIGSFINPDAVRKILGQSGQTHKSTDDEFDKVSEALLTDMPEASSGRRRRKRNIVQE